MAANLDQKVDQLIQDQLILQNYPDDYVFHPTPDPLVVKVDGETMLGVFARDGGQDGADFNQISVMSPVQFSEFIRTLPDAGPDDTGQVSIFLKDKATNMNVAAEFVAVGRRDADIEVSSADVSNSANIYIEQGYQPRGNVVEIPQELLDHLNVEPETPKPEPIKDDFNNVAPDVSYSPRPDVTIVDEVRAQYKDILSSDKDGINKRDDVNHEVGTLLRYLSREKNFEGHDPAFFKDELHETISDLKTLGLNDQAVVLENYEANIDNGMGHRDARNQARDELREITTPVTSENNVQQDLGPQRAVAAESQSEDVDREIQDRLAREDASNKWMKESFDVLSNSDEALAYKEAVLSGEGVEEAKRNLDQLVSDLKAESFPNHKSIAERADSVQKQVIGISPVLEAAFFERLQDAGADPEIGLKEKQAFADAVMRGASKDDVQKIFNETPDDARQVLMGRIILEMDDTIADMKKGLYDHQSEYSNMVDVGVRDIVNSPEFQENLEQYLEAVKANAMEQAGAMDGIKANELAAPEAAVNGIKP